MKKTLFLMASMALIATSCGDNKKTDTSTEASEQPQVTANENVTPSEVQDDNSVNITLRTTDNMLFDLSEIRVKAGQVIHLNLVHIGKMDKRVMGHNFVLLKKGTDIMAFGQAAANAIENDFIPKEYADQVIAHTKIIGAGESDSITFTAPEAGSYDYICSFTGHYVMMKGKLIVE